MTLQDPARAPVALEAGAFPVGRLRLPAGAAAETCRAGA